MNRLALAFAVCGLAMGRETGENKNGEVVAQLPEEAGDPRVRAAMITAWNESSHGTETLEAGFRLDGTPSDFTVVASQFTNQRMKQTMAITPATFAIFHIHPLRGNPEPSPADKRMADTFKVKVFTIHAWGLHVYDPATGKITKLRDGVGWMKR